MLTLGGKKSNFPIATSRPRGLFIKKNIIRTDTSYKNFLIFKEKKNISSLRTVC